MMVAVVASLPAAGHASTLYIDANIAAAGQNAVLAYDIAPDGSLSPVRGSPFPTGGSGFVDPSYNLGVFDNDQEVSLDAAKNVLYAVNAGSNTIAAFFISRDGALSPVLNSPFQSHGNTPVSLGQRGNLLTVINNAQDPAQVGTGVPPSITVDSIGADGNLAFLPHDTVKLPAIDQPSQALVANTAPFVFNTSQPNDPTVQAYYQFPNGELYQTDKVVAPVLNGVQGLPLGLWANPSKPYLYVGLDFFSVTSSGVAVPSKLAVYTWSPTGKLTLVDEAASAGGALCWIRSTRDGKYLYTSNTFDNSLSVFDASRPDRPVEIQHLVIGGSGGVDQLSLTPDEKFVYVLQEINSPASVGHSNILYGLSIDPTSHLLTLHRNLSLRLPVSAATHPFGLAIR